MSRISVIIPYFNRYKTLPDTLDSIDAARGEHDVEVILVDDGSCPPAETQLKPQELDRVTKLVTQANQGLLFARLAGLPEATGEFVLFLDSDDLIGPGKFRDQIARQEEEGADVSYSDHAEVDLTLPPIERVPLNVHNSTDTSDVLELMLRVQPVPHSPVFRNAFLQSALASPIVPALPAYNPVAEVWFYHNCALQSGSAIKIPGIHSLVGRHEGPRITQNWERMGFAATAIAEAFVENCPSGKAVEKARQIIAHKAFAAWLRSPTGYSKSYQNRLLQLWRTAPDPRNAARGGRKFELLSRLLGPLQAGRLHRTFWGQRYSHCRTITDEELLILERNA